MTPPPEGRPTLPLMSRVSSPSKDTEPLPPITPKSLHSPSLWEDSVAWHDGVDIPVSEGVAAFEDVDDTVDEDVDVVVGVIELE